MVGLRTLFVRFLVLFTVISGLCPAGAGAASRYTIWPASSVPALDAVSDGQPIEVGVKFRSDVSGTITGLRFYKGAANTGSHVANLWSGDGVLLASIPFTAETPSGWQEVSFATPVAIAANTTYIASCYSPSGVFAVSHADFVAGVDAPPLHALANGADGGNGVYRYGDSGFPGQSYNANNYWVDVVFSSDTVVTPSASPTLWDATALPGVTDAGEDGPVELGVRFTSDKAGSITGIRFYKSTANTGTHIGNLWSESGALLASVVFTNETASGWQQANFATPVAISANTVYVASYHAGSGHYSYDYNYFAGKGVDSNPLHAPADGVSGSNGIYAYGAASQFPTQTWKSSNYWVDVVYSSDIPTTSPTPSPTLWDAAALPGTDDSGPDRAVELGVRFKSDSAGFITGIRFYKSAANTGTHVGNLWSESGTLLASAIFTSETASGWQQVAFATPVAISANTIYVASYHTGSGHYSYDYNYFAGKGVDRNPLHALADGVMGGNGVFAYGEASQFPTLSWMSSNYWVDVVYSTQKPVDKPPVASAGPILLVSSTSNPFSKYYEEVLRTEGLNAFDRKDIGDVTSSLLSNYDIVLLGEFPLSASQATMLSDWVNAGGRLVAMRPDSKLAGLLGLTDLGSTLADRYLLVNTSSGPGTGIVGQTIQYHGSANLYGLNGAASLATLYSDAGTATTNPAVTLRNVGTNGGKAAAFAYDLARSVVYTRQGNPAWSGQERDGYFPIRTDDLFYGNASFDPQPDWIDLNKVAIPQADEQQRLLANLIIQMNQDKKPLPRFWYFPRNLKAVVVMTGDDHGWGTAGTAGRFDGFSAYSPPGCSVDNWECIRGTSYVFPVDAVQLSNAQAVAYNAAGFEVALHVNSGNYLSWDASVSCDNFTPLSFEATVASQLSVFRQKYPDLAAPVTNRNHCVTWSDYSTVPTVELNHGIRLDTSYYYWPPGWIGDSGFFTGSGMPMRFTQADGTLMDVYQAPTQMTDESGQAYPATVNALLDRAIGSEGYYGAFVANMHTDVPVWSESDEIVKSAKSRGVAVVSARQMLKWLDGRNGSSFSGFSWNGSTLAFSVSAGQGTNGLVAMVPLGSGQTVTGVTGNSSSLSFETVTIKGMRYARFPVSSGNYQVVFQ